MSCCKDAPDSYSVQSPWHFEGETIMKIRLFKYIENFTKKKKKKKKKKKVR